MTEEILREGFSDDELVTTQEWCEQKGVSATAFSGRMSRYADNSPKPARLRDGHTKLWVLKEMEDFYSLPTDRTTPRSMTDVLRSDIARLRDREEEYKKHRDKRQRDLDVSQQRLDRVQRQLRQKLEELSLLTK